eukprot:TRINITY_DN28633_c0_g1_i2.p1 TRINITY_DN28633_c0_g1~~TRINITY_DN28633_c0_g1_i2.p1  ORF type:complete len:306 (+),score=65.13 TRINITY_DN28633_c0_g1_i2:39-920(+)
MFRSPLAALVGSFATYYLLEHPRERSTSSEATLRPSAALDDLEADPGVLLHDDVASGSRVLSVTSSARLGVGQPLRLNAGGLNEEDVRVSGLGDGGTVVLQGALRYGHESGEAISPLLALEELAAENAGDALGGLSAALRSTGELLADGGRYIAAGLLGPVARVESFDAARESAASVLADAGSRLAAAPGSAAVRGAVDAALGSSLATRAQEVFSRRATSVVSSFLEHYPEHRVSLEGRNPLLLVVLFFALTALSLWELVRCSRATVWFGRCCLQATAAFFRWCCRPKAPAHK